jgi:oxygen-dependent protoporphyrinogen oxidase
MFQLDDDEMLLRIKSDLRDLLGTRGEPAFVETTKWFQSMPQYEVGHLARLAEIERDVAELGNIELAGNSYGGAGIPDCIRSGESAAEKLFGLTIGKE